MSTQRDALAQIVMSIAVRPDLLDYRGDYDSGALFLGDAQRIASKVIAAGYRKPRAITTAEELDALQCGVVIREKHHGIVWEKQGDGEGGFIWVMTGSDEAESDPGITLPATVLYEPTA